MTETVVVPNPAAPAPAADKPAKPKVRFCVECGFDFPTAQTRVNCRVPNACTKRQAANKAAGVTVDATGQKPPTLNGQRVNVRGLVPRTVGPAPAPAPTPPAPVPAAAAKPGTELVPAAKPTPPAGKPQAARTPVKPGTKSAPKPGARQ